MEPASSPTSASTVRPSDSITFFEGPIFFDANSSLCVTYELDKDTLRLLPWNPESSAGQVWHLYRSECLTGIETCTVRTIIGSDEYVMVISNGKTIAMESEFKKRPGKLSEDCFYFMRLSDGTYQLVSFIQDSGVTNSALGVDKVQMGGRIKLKNPVDPNGTALLLRDEDFVH